MVGFLISWDEWLFRLINQQADHPLLSEGLAAVASFFSAKPVIITVLCFLAGWALARKAKALTIVVGLILCGVSADHLNGGLIKPLFQRPRPFVALNNVQLKIVRPQSSSFPSSHAVTAFAVATYLGLLVGQFWLWGPVAVLVALSRVYVGVHYPSDVMAGAICGAIIGYVFALLIRRALRRYMHRYARPTLD